MLPILSVWGKLMSRRVNKLDKLDKLTSCLRKRQSNIVSGQVNKLHAIKKNSFLCYLVFDTSNLFTRLLPSITSNLSTRLTRLLVNHRKLNSQTENQKGTNSVRINALLACKRCPLRPLLTPFWNPIKPLLVCDFVTY